MVINQEESPYGFINKTNRNDCYLCSARFFCDIPKNIPCNQGYCTFPYNNIDKQYILSSIFPHSIYSTNIKNTDNNKNYFQIKLDNNNIKQRFKTKTEINLNDDIEVYFADNNLSQQVISRII